MRISCFLLENGSKSLITRKEYPKLTVSHQPEIKKSQPQSLLAYSKRSLVNRNSYSRDFGLLNASNDCIFVRGISWITGKAQLKEYFEQFGPIIDVDMRVNRDIGIHSGSASIKFKHEGMMKDLLERDRYHIIDGKKVTITPYYIKGVLKQMTRSHPRKDNNDLTGL